MSHFEAAVLMLAAFAGMAMLALWGIKRPTMRRDAPSAVDVVYDLRVAESALKVIERELEQIPSSALGDHWNQIVNMDAAVGAWRQGFIAQPR